jgi:hypothetical protein
MYQVLLHIDGPNGGFKFVAEFADMYQFEQHAEEHYQFFMQDIMKWFNTKYDPSTWNKYNYDYASPAVASEEGVVYPVIQATWKF